jgi:hypothetical protein
VSLEELRAANIIGTLCVSHPLLSEATSLLVSDVNNYVIVRQSLESVFYIPRVLILHEGSPRVLIGDSSIILLPTHGSLGSSVGMATGYTLGGRGVRVRGQVWARFCSSPRHTYRFWAHPFSCPSGYWDIFPLEGGEKRPEREADSHFYVVPRSGIHGSVHPLPNTSS